MPTKPKPFAKNVPGDLDNFSNFVRRLMAVPHDELKVRLDAEKEEKRTSRASASRASGVSPRKHS